MLNFVRSVWVWVSTLLLVVAWTPVLAVRRLFDKDPVRYGTGRLFRDLGVAMVRINPYWHVSISGDLPKDPRRPYIVVSNHQSSADIPFLSHLPWEMKWMAKSELFKVPFTGWMLRLAGDIRVDRKSPRSAAIALRRAAWYLERKCSVMVFAEGTRTPDGRVHDFMTGAFHLAIESGTPILPIAIDGSFDCLPKQTWRFGRVDRIRIHVLPEVETSDLSPSEVKNLTFQVRRAIIDEIAAWRGVSPGALDASRLARTNSH